MGRPGQPWGPSCQVLEPLGGFLGRLGRNLVASGAVLEASWELWGRLGRNLVASWAFLEASWELLGPSWAQLGGLLGLLGGLLGASWQEEAVVPRIVAPLGAFLEAKGVTEACILRYFLHVGVFGLRKDLRGPEGG